MQNQLQAPSPPTAKSNENINDTRTTQKQQKKQKTSQKSSHDNHVATQCSGYDLTCRAVINERSAFGRFDAHFFVILWFRKMIARADTEGLVFPWSMLAMMEVVAVAMMVTVVMVMMGWC